MLPDGWQKIVSCPNCGEGFSSNDITLLAEICKKCHIHWRIEDNILIWEGQETVPLNKKWKIVLKKIKNQFNPLSSWFLPFRYITHIQVEKYYQRTLNDAKLATKWCSHYLKDLNLNPGDIILDYGCGRGRFTALSNQMGFITQGQDIYKNSWWKQISKSSFQTIPSHYEKLPWANQSFSAVFSFGVTHYLNEESLNNHFKEIFRILKPGGYLVLLEANDQSYGSQLPRKQIGRLHSLETIRSLNFNAGFKELSLTYEGFYAPIFPLLINFFRKQCSLRQFDISDFDSRLESITPPIRRALWLMKLQKPILMQGS